MTRAQAVQLILESNGKILGLEFIKRTTGEVRTGAFRIGVVRVKGDLGSGRAYDPSDYGLVTVWDMAKGYRSIPVEGLLAVTHAGVRHIITDSPDNPISQEN